jgi:hypothetical protein
MQQPFPLRMMGYSAIHAGNLIRARTLITESLKGNHVQGHIPGQLSCLIALGACELEEGNAAKAVTLATLVGSRLQAESYSLMEPDSIALNDLLTTGKEKLGKKPFEQAVVNGRALDMAELVAQELPPSA